MHEDEDKAWAEFNTPLDKKSLHEFCLDVERLLRINPYLFIENWKKYSAKHFHLQAFNHSQEPAFNIETDLSVSTTSDGLEIRYRDGLKSSTSISTTDAGSGSKLTIIEKYENLPKEQRHKHLHEIDKSLRKWAQELQLFLISWHRWSWFLPWRYYKQHIWLPMKPTARRITYIILCISIVEIMLILLGTMIYFIEYK